jgi:hypothetical protein
VTHGEQRRDEQSVTKSEHGLIFPRVGGVVFRGQKVTTAIEKRRVPVTVTADKLPRLKSP